MGGFGNMGGFKDMGGGDKWRRYVEEIRIPNFHWPLYSSMTIWFLNNSIFLRKKGGSPRVDFSRRGGGESEERRLWRNNRL